MAAAAAAVVAAGVVCGASAMASAAPSASRPAPPKTAVPGGPAAPAAVPAAPVERRLFSDSIEASSFLWNDWNRFQENYHPNYLADDDPATGWVEGAASSGAGEWVRIAVTPLGQTSAVRLRVRNGYQKSRALFRANARVKDVIVKLLPGGTELKTTLTDKQGWQEVRVAQPAGMLRGIELKIVSVYEGSKYADLVISDVQVLATSLTRENPAFEKSKRQSLLEWRKARMAAAKLFKAGRGATLPLYSSYRAVSQPVPAAAEELLRRDIDLAGMLKAAAADAAFAEWRDAVKVGLAVVADEAALIPAQLSPVASAELPEVDGFELQGLAEAAEGIIQDGTLRLPVLGHASAFFADKLRVLDQKGSTPKQFREGVYVGSCEPGTWVKRVKAREADAPDRVAALLVARCGEVPSREGTSIAKMEQLMVFGDDGRLLLVAGEGYIDGYRWERGGKIAGGRSLQYNTAVELAKGQVAEQ